MLDDENMNQASFEGRVLAITGGHSFDRDAFSHLLSCLPFQVTWIEQPDALAWLNPQRLHGFDATLHYDMPGGREAPIEPPAEVVEGIRNLIAAGHGFVLLHHALASWPAWPEWAEWAGGRFLYAPGRLRDQHWPDSGFRHCVKQHLSPVGDHPILAGLEDGLDVIDETYLCPVFEGEVTPLLRTDAVLSDKNHLSTQSALRAGSANPPHDALWHHPPGSSLAAWCREVDRSRWVYVQPGDTGYTLRDGRYQRLVANSLSWAMRRAG